LKYIDVFGGCNTVSRAMVLFESAGSAELRLEHIVLRVGLTGPLDRDSLRRADDTIAEMNSPHLRGVHCELSIVCSLRPNSLSRSVRCTPSSRRSLLFLTLCQDHLFLTSRQEYYIPPPYSDILLLFLSTSRHTSFHILLFTEPATGYLTLLQRIA
jgi:hypothetical protein